MHSFSQSSEGLPVTLEQFRAVKDQQGWRNFAIVLLNESAPTSEAIDQFGTYWVEAGHHIREQIADDQVLVRLLRRLLPPYHGEAITLFRGENTDRWTSGDVGFAWTARIETARMFGSGLNAIGSGGVLLKADFQPEAIISGPNAHSSYLNESQFTIDPFAGTAISEIGSFPPITRQNPLD